MEKNTVTTTSGKNFKLKSSARRAALREVKEGQFEIIEDEKGEGFYWFSPVVASGLLSESGSSVIAESEVIAVSVPESKKKEIKIVLVTEEEAAAEARVKAELDLRESLSSKVVEVENTPEKKKSSVKTKMPSWAEGKHLSQIESPTKTVWHIADLMYSQNPNVARKAIVEHCVKQGIAYYTARTQVQLWRTARLESEANSAKVNAKR